MILSGLLVLPGSGASVRLAPGWLRVEGGLIAEVHEGKPDARADLGGEGCLISPGLIDAHLHLPQFDSIGADGLELLEWLATVIFPAEIRWEDADYGADMALRVGRQLLAHGTTTIAAYATVHHLATQRAIHALAGLGLRGFVGQTLMDREAPPELTRPAAQLLKEAAAVKGVGRIEPAVTPRFAISCTDELMMGAGELAAATGATIQTHMSETLPEIAYVRKLFDGEDYTDVYRDVGLLTPKTLLGHVIHVSDTERQTLKETGAVAAHCPTANTFLHAGRMNLSAHRRAGVRIALGSDVAGGPDRSMVRVARAMIETAKSLGNIPPHGVQAWHQMTAGNAEVMGLSNAGRLKKGDAADLIVVKPDITWTDCLDPLLRLIYAWDDRWLKATIAHGNVAYSA